MLTAISIAFAKIMTLYRIKDSGEIHGYCTDSYGSGWYSLSANDVSNILSWRSPKGISKVISNTIKTEKKKIRKAEEDKNKRAINMLAASKMILHKANSLPPELEDTIRQLTKNNMGLYEEALKEVNELEGVDEDAVERIVQQEFKKAFALTNKSQTI